MPINKTALVLSGGGSKGAYQVGVFQALRELDYQIDVITGTSVGALNAAIFTAGDLDVALEVWSEINNEMVLTLSDEDRERLKGKTFQTYAKEFIKNKGIDYKPLKDLLIKYINEEKFFNSNIDFGLVTVEMKGLKKIQITKNTIEKSMLVDYMLASAACFPAFKPYIINETAYIDGGYQDNLPVQLALEMGANQLIIVDLNTIGIVSGESKKIINDNRSIYITPYWALGDFLYFEKQIAKRNIRLGYLDAMKALNVYEGRAYAFVKSDFQKFERQIKDKKEKIFEQTGINFSFRDGGVLKDISFALLKKTLKSHWAGAYSNNKLILTCAEVCGEIFELDCLFLYSVEHFNRVLLRKVLESRAKNLKLNAKMNEGKHGIELIKELANTIDRKTLIVYLADYMDKKIKEKNAKDLARIAAMFPSEYMSAFYINVAEL